MVHLGLFLESQSHRHRERCLGLGHHRIAEDHDQVASQVHARVDQVVKPIEDHDQVASQVHARVDQVVKPIEDHDQVASQVHARVDQVASQDHERAVPQRVDQEAIEDHDQVASQDHERVVPQRVDQEAIEDHDQVASQDHARADQVADLPLGAQQVRAHRHQPQGARLLVGAELPRGSPSAGRRRILRSWSRLRSLPTHRLMRPFPILR